jgi:hypothetical protein
MVPAIPHAMAPEEPTSLRLQVLEKTSALVTAAFGLVAALAWNETVKAVIAKYYAAGDGLSALLLYAVLVTILAVVASVLVARAVSKARAQGSA